MRGVAVIGALFVSLAGAAEAAAGGAGAAGRGCDRVDVYRYKLTVTGAKTGHETWLPPAETTGEFSFAYRYVVRYPSFRVVVDRGCGPELTTVRARGRGTGELESYAWADHAVPKDQSDGTELPCDFQATTEGLRAGLRIAGGTAVRGGSRATFSVQSELRHGAVTALIALLDGRREAACNKGELSNVNLLEELVTHTSVPIYDNSTRAGGVKVDPPSLAFGGSLLGGGRRTPRPLARLARGKSASMSTGPRSFHDVDDQTEAAATTSVTLRFERRR